MMVEHREPRGDAELESWARPATSARFKLSPPFNRGDAGKHWPGLSQDEIAEVIEQHLRDRHRVRPDALRVSTNELWHRPIIRPRFGASLCGHQ